MKNRKKPIQHMKGVAARINPNAEGVEVGKLTNYTIYFKICEVLGQKTRSIIAKNNFESAAFILPVGIQTTNKISSYGRKHIESKHLKKIHAVIEMESEQKSLDTCLSEIFKKIDDPQQAIFLYDTDTHRLVLFVKLDLKEKNVPFALVFGPRTDLSFNIITFYTPSKENRDVFCNKFTSGSSKRFKTIFETQWRIKPSITSQTPDESPLSSNVPTKTNPPSSIFQKPEIPVAVQTKEEINKEPVKKEEIKAESINNDEMEEINEQNQLIGVEDMLEEGLIQEGFYLEQVTTWKAAQEEVNKAKGETTSIKQSVMNALQIQKNIQTRIAKADKNWRGNPITSDAELISRYNEFLAISQDVSESFQKIQANYTKEGIDKINKNINSKFPILARLDEVEVPFIMYETLLEYNGIVSSISKTIEATIEENVKVNKNNAIIAYSFVKDAYRYFTECVSKTQNYQKAIQNPQTKAIMDVFEAITNEFYDNFNGMIVECKTKYPTFNINTKIVDEFREVFDQYKKGLQQRTSSKRK